MVNAIEIVLYLTDVGNSPFIDWFDELDSHDKHIIENRLYRINMGNFGIYKSVGDGVFELKINHGPGYRLYYGREGNKLIILLTGGDKGSQSKDINKAKEYWLDYKEKNNEKNNTMGRRTERKIERSRI